MNLAELLHHYGAFLTGEFTLKSGAKSPYFINFGTIDDATGINRLGELFAMSIVEELGEDGFDLIAGPAYKGIPIAVTTGLAIERLFKRNVGVIYSRKEKKAHGEGSDSLWVGRLDNPKPHGQGRIVIVDDVFTTGGTKLEMLNELKQLKAPEGIKPRVVGLAVGIDRQQHASAGGENMLKFCKQHGIKPIVLSTAQQLMADLARLEK